MDYVSSGSPLTSGYLSAPYVGGYSQYPYYSDNTGQWPELVQPIVQPLMVGFPQVVEETLFYYSNTTGTISFGTALGLPRSVIQFLLRGTTPIRIECVLFVERKVIQCSKWEEGIPLNLPPQ